MDLKHRSRCQQPYISAAHRLTNSAGPEPCWLVAGNSGGQEARERSMYKTSLFWFVVATASLSLICVAGAVVFWGWLHPAVPYTVSNSETLRNVGLLVGGVLAFVFALWRVLVAERQSDTAQCQANTAQQSLLHERYERGAQMLGSSVLTVRLGGIYILERLASEHPAQYHVDVTRLFCVFVRLQERGDGVSCYPEADDEQDHQMPTLRADIQDAMQAIGSRSREGIHFEQAGRIQAISARRECEPPPSSRREFFESVAYRGQPFPRRNAAC